MKILCAANVVMVILAATVWSAENAPRFGVYRAGPDGGDAILTDRDVIDYCWEDQFLELTPRAVEHWRAQGWFSGPRQGTPLVIKVDGKRCYEAVVVNPVSSFMPAGPQFSAFLFPDNKLRLSRGCWNSEEDPPPDLRFDNKVKAVFFELGKLTESCD